MYWVIKVEGTSGCVGLNAENHVAVAWCWVSKEVMQIRHRFRYLFWVCQILIFYGLMELVVPEHLPCTALEILGKQLSCWVTCFVSHCALLK